MTRQQKIIVIAFILFCTLLAVVIPITIAATGESTPIAILKFQGTGDAITTPFIIRGSPNSPIEFQVKWKAQPEDSFFSFDVHYASVNNPILDGNPYKVMEGDIPISFYHPNPLADAGEFVIEVIASHNSQWIIEIWQ